MMESIPICKVYLLFIIYFYYLRIADTFDDNHAQLLLTPLRSTPDSLQPQLHAPPFVI